MLVIKALVSGDFQAFLIIFPFREGVTKRCLLSLLTNSALVYEFKCRGIGGVAGFQPTRTAVHIT
jgi:hypothetical protein